MEELKVPPINIYRVVIRYFIWCIKYLINKQKAYYNPEFSPREWIRCYNGVFGDTVIAKRMVNTLTLEEIQAFLKLKSKDQNIKLFKKVYGTMMFPYFHLRNDKWLRDLITRTRYYGWGFNIDDLNKMQASFFQTLYDGYPDGELKMYYLNDYIFIPNSKNVKYILKIYEKCRELFPIDFPRHWKSEEGMNGRSAYHYFNNDRILVKY